MFIIRAIGIMAFALMLHADKATAQEAEIVEHIEQWWSGWAQRDTTILADLADENFMEFSGSHTHRSEGKVKLLQIAKAVFPLLELQEFSIEKPKVTLHGTTAVCHYYYFERGRFNGKEFDDAGCATGVFIRKDGKWKMISHHRTKFNKSIPYER